MGKIFGLAVAAAALACGLGGVSAQAANVSEFYQGKQVRVIIGYGAGGGYDVYARFVTRHMARFIPGKPTMVPQNMPGAGSAVAAQFLTHRAPRDGSVLATLGQNLPLDQALRPEKAKYDTRKLIWIGNVNEGNNVIMMWHASGIKTFDDAKKKEVFVPATGVTSTSVMYPRALNNIFDTKFKIIIGFGGGRELNLAIERGEMHGRGSIAWATIKANAPHYLAEKKVNIILQMGLKKEKDLPDVPLIVDLARNEAERAVLELIAAGVAIGRPILTTPDVPAERATALRAAFEATMKDDTFQAEAKKARLDVNPVSGIELQRIVEKVVGAPKDVIELTRAALTKGETFNCAAIVEDKTLCRKPKKKKAKKGSK